MVAFDMKDGILFSDILDTFFVLRRLQDINNYGRAQNTQEWSASILGVVTPTSPRNLKRLPDEQRQAKSIEVITSFPLQGPSNLNSPDIVSWNGDNFVVIVIDDWSNFGPGWVHAICTSIDSVDLPPIASGVGQP